MRTVHLAPKRSKPLAHGRFWIFDDAIERVDEGEDDFVRVVDADGAALGVGFYSPHSRIRVRLLERGDVSSAASADDLLRARIEAAVAARARLFPDPDRTDAYRLVHSEGDGLPGLVVDRYAHVLVAQFSTLPFWRRRASLARLLLEFDRRGDAPLARRREGGRRRDFGRGRRVRRRSRRARIGRRARGRTRVHDRPPRGPEDGPLRGPAGEPPARRRLRARGARPRPLLRHRGLLAPRRSRTGPPSPAGSTRPRGPSTLGARERRGERDGGALRSDRGRRGRGARRARRRPATRSTS